MNTSGKVLIGLVVVGVVGGAVMLAAPKKASAAPRPALPPPPPVPPTPGAPVLSQGTGGASGDVTGGGVVLAPPSGAPPGTPAIVVPPLSGAQPAPVPGGGIVVPTPGGPVTLPPGTLPQVTSTPGGGSVLTLPGGAQVPMPLPGGTINLPTLPITASPPVVAGDGGPTAPADTVAVVQAMLDAEAAGGTGWRSTPIPGLAEWQTARGLTGDGKFGTGTALKMAEEIGSVPIVRAWPRGSYPSGHWLPEYKASLVQIATTKTGAHKDLLMRSSVREQGQGFGTPPQPINDLLTVEG